MTPDSRILITKMAAELDHCQQLLMDDRRQRHPLADRARALLAEPVIPVKQRVFPTPSQAAECGGPCYEGSYSPEACDCGLYQPPALAQPMAVSERLPQAELAAIIHEAVPSLDVLCNPCLSSEELADVLLAHPRLCISPAHALPTPEATND